MVTAESVDAIPIKEPNSPPRAVPRGLHVPNVKISSHRCDLYDPCVVSQSGDI